MPTMRTCIALVVCTAVPLIVVGCQQDRKPDLVGTYDAPLSAEDLGWRKQSLAFPIRSREVIEVAALVVRDGQVAPGDRCGTRYAELYPGSVFNPCFTWYMIAPGGYLHPGGDRMQFRLGSLRGPALDGGPATWTFGLWVWIPEPQIGPEWTIAAIERGLPAVEASDEDEADAVTSTPSAPPYRQLLVIACRRRPLDSADPDFRHLFATNFPNGTHPLVPSDADTAQILELVAKWKLPVGAAFPKPAEPQPPGF